MKQKLVGLLRSTGLLPLAEKVRFWGAIPMHARRNRAFLAAHPDFVVPPRFLMYDACGTINYESFFLKGASVAKQIIHIVSQHLAPDRPVSVCEWGCGPARILRHIPPLLPAESRVFGTDYNAKTIAWCTSHLEGVTFRLNGLAPPLPFSTGELDLIYAVSVFTHLSEDMHFAWLAECRRVVRPGGLILLTVHGDQAADRLSPGERASYDAGRFVVRGSVLEGSRTFVAYQSPRFMREVLLRDLEIVLHNPPEGSGIGGTQDVYLARTPEVAALKTR